MLDVTQINSCTYRVTGICCYEYIFMPGKNGGSWSEGMQAKYRVAKQIGIQTRTQDTNGLAGSTDLILNFYNI